MKTIEMYVCMYVLGCVGLCCSSSCLYKRIRSQMASGGIDGTTVV